MDFLSYEPPRVPALFPYTTLFRSRGLRARARRRGRPGEPGGLQPRASLAPGPHRRGVRVEPCRRSPAQGDRKSTRLNSSHTVISYAVFCLKKKRTRLDMNHILLTS